MNLLLNYESDIDELQDEEVVEENKIGGIISNFIYTPTLNFKLYRGLFGKFVQKVSVVIKAASRNIVRRKRYFSIK